MYPIEIYARWREELVATSADGILIFEFMMGSEHAYFPDQARWLEMAPVWARDKWQNYLDACQLWCKQNRYPISIVSDTYFHEGK